MNKSNFDQVFMTALEYRRMLAGHPKPYETALAKSTKKTKSGKDKWLASCYNPETEEILDQRFAIKTFDKFTGINKISYERFDLLEYKKEKEQQREKQAENAPVTPDSDRGEITVDVGDDSDIESHPQY